MSEETTPLPPPKDGAVFRATIGIIALLGALAGFFALFFIEVPASNKEPMLLALGFVMGWASSVVSSEYGASATGRKAADATIKRAEGDPSSTKEKTNA